MIHVVMKHSVSWFTQQCKWNHRKKQCVLDDDVVKTHSRRDSVWFWWSKERQSLQNQANEAFVYEERRSIETVKLSHFREKRFCALHAQAFLTDFVGDTSCNFGRFFSFDTFLLLSKFVLRTKSLIYSDQREYYQKLTHTSVKERLTHENERGNEIPFISTLNQVLLRVLPRVLHRVLPWHIKSLQNVTS